MRLLTYWFSDVKKSQMKVSKASVTACKHSILCKLFVFLFLSKSFFSHKVVDLLADPTKSQIKASKIWAKVWKDSDSCKKSGLAFVSKWLGFFRERHFFIGAVPTLQSKAVMLSGKPSHDLILDKILIFYQNKGLERA